MRWWLAGLIVLHVVPSGARGQTATPDQIALAADVGLPDWTAEALLAHGSDLRRLEGLDSLGAPYPVPGLSIAISQDRVESAIRALRPRFGAGVIVFQSEQNFGPRPDRLAVLRTRDPLDAVRVMGTRGVNHGIDTDSIISRLRDWDVRYGLGIIGAGRDWVEADLTVLDEVDRLAAEVFAFCPDVVEQGTGTVEALADEMRRRRKLYLWWD